VACTSYIGLDAGGALLLDADHTPLTGALAFGLHAGYRLPSGLAFDLRADELGVDAPDGGGPLIAGGLGMRYTVPLEVMPFVEAHLGALEYGPVSLAGDAAVGLALPIGNHLEMYPFTRSLADRGIALCGSILRVMTRIRCPLA
jgi:hypothetical protein